MILQLWLLLNSLCSEEVICLYRYRIDSRPSFIYALTFLSFFNLNLFLHGLIYESFCLFDRSWTCYWGFIIAATLQWVFKYWWIAASWPWICFWLLILFLNLWHILLCHKHQSCGHVFLYRVIAAVLLILIFLFLLFCVFRSLNLLLFLRTVRVFFVFWRRKELLFNLLDSFPVDLIHTFLMLVLVQLSKCGCRLMTHVNLFLELSFQLS